KIQCSESDDCIPRAWECDGIKDDCPGNTDEQDCPDCSGIYCDYNETFVPWARVCDSYRDCDDGADENRKIYGCDCRGFKCPSEYCIPKNWRCDYILDCWPTGEDEFDCPCEGPDVFQCDYGPCLYNFYKCDGYKNCPNGEDEDGCPCAFQCPDGPCLPHSWQVCNGIADCPYDEDELDCPCDPDEFHCPGANSTCIPLEKRCDCVPDCPDGCDEDNCERPIPPSPKPPGLPYGPVGPTVYAMDIAPKYPELEKLILLRESLPARKEGEEKEPGATGHSRNYYL
ncbi:unnamed protein product, partial [Allacma fusca]